MKFDLIVVSTTSSRSESAKIILGFLPPSSNDSFFKELDAAFIIAESVPGSPIFHPFFEEANRQ
jgi:hypothetical protein